MTEQDQQLAEENYILVQPQSSESQRLEKEYPLVKDQPIRVLKTGLSEETKAAMDEAYGKAAYAFMLYMQSEGESLQEYAKQAAMAGMGAGQMPEGQMPEGALPDGEMPPEGDAVDGQLPGMDASQASSSETSQLSANTASLPQVTLLGETSSSISSQPTEDQESQDPAQEDTEAPGITGAEGFADVDISQLYQLAPLLSQMPQEGIQKAIDDAHGASATMMADQVGVTFKKLFYFTIFKLYQLLYKLLILII